jgi:Holliday junction resolvasome RuvABC endonuclease subunit
MENTPTRIFAIDPTTKGFGYAVFELPFRLVEWGLARVTGEKHAGAVLRFEQLLARFRPDAVVLEDAEAPGSRRQLRVRRLIEALTKLARERGIAVYTIARSAVLKCFSSADNVATKQSIARNLAGRFPELAEQLPPPRKLWQTEHERMSVFDALALAVTHANS